jgi:hypothetical protein
MDDLPDALNRPRFLLPVHKPACNLGLLCQVFSFPKSFSGWFIVVVRVTLCGGENPAASDTVP